MPNIFEKEFDLPLPTCCNTGDCCKGASPSTPYHKLFRRAADGDEFARGFFSVMIPYASHAEARKVVPGVVDRTLAAAKKLDEFQDPERDIVFYHCRYHLPDNRCGVHEDRPQFCRDYPDTPFVVMAPGCAFESWSVACREKYRQMQSDIAQLSALKEKLADLKEMSLSPHWFEIAQQEVHQEDNDYSLLSTVLSMCPLYLASPLRSFFFI